MQTDILYIVNLVNSHKMKKFLILILFVTFSCKAQNTMSLAEGESSPKAPLEVISWMEGHWKGEAFGGITEEIWSPALGGSMMFSFNSCFKASILCIV